MSRCLLSLLIACLAATSVRAEVDYSSEIKPLLFEKCAACHGVLKQEAGLRLDSGVLIRTGSDAGKVIDVEDPSASELLQRITSPDPSLRMPPEGEGAPLSESQTRLLREWIQQGAPSPDDEVAAASPQAHWAYQPPLRPELPTEVPSDWSRHPIDALVYEQLADAGLVSVGVAEPSLLIRRLHLDVTGLPPTPQEQTSFLNDRASDRWRRRVEQLLADPAYGERWGRHWMDVWRYSDWDGYKNEVRGSQRHIWHWRDWIVESLNADQGYDQMVREMLAADELAPEDFDSVRATGFLVRNFHVSNRDIWLDATVEHTAKAFLGMTLACARCHDHKFDPLLQREYYAFRSIFEPHRVRTERLPGAPDIELAGLPRAYDADLGLFAFVYERGNEKHFDKEDPVAPAPPAIVSVPFEVHPVELPLTAAHPVLRSYVEQETLADLERKVTRAVADLAAAERDEPAQTDPSVASTTLAIARQAVVAAKAELRSVQHRWSADKAKIHQQTEAGELAQQACDAERSFLVEQASLEVMRQQAAIATAQASEQADPAKKKTAVEAAEKQLVPLEKKLADAQAKLASAEVSYTPVGPSYPSSSSGRRRALADWITHRDNPLTARVAINHIWMRHFGEPLVENMDDFGLRSPLPPHAKLLDWLAVEWMENNWSMKHIHRLILTSRLYQLASTTAGLSAAERQANLARDPDNRLLWRAHVRRLDAEVIRDSLLSVAGSLDRTLGGPEIDFREGEKNPRRSLYFRHAYEKQMGLLVVFDAASPTECYRRSTSIIPQQALALANSPLAITQSRRLASQLWAEVSDDRAFVTQAVRILLGREPTEEEASACEAFLQDQTLRLSDLAALHPLGGTAVAATQAATDARARARENLIHVLINHNDFLSIR